METAVKCKGGGLNPILKNAELIYPGGRKYILEIFQDISVLKAAEDQLKISEIRYRELVENSPTGILLIDRDGNIVDMNPAAAKIYGSPSSEDSIKRINLFNHAQLRNSAEKFRECLRGNIVTSHEEYYTSIWDKELYLRYDASPNHDEYGEIKGITVNVQDFTERKKAEVEMKQMNEVLCELNEKLTLTEEEMIEQLYEITEIQKALTLSNKKLKILSAIIRHDILNQITVLRGYLELALEFEDKESSDIFLKKTDSAAEIIQNQIEFTGDYEEPGISEPKMAEYFRYYQKTSEQKNTGKQKMHGY
jgi:PAS domain S-box-containing protein